MFQRHDLARNACMLTGSFRKQGYDWWWHSFTGISEETGKERTFFIEYFICNPALGWDKPILGQLPKNRENGLRPSYLMVKAGSWGEGKGQLHRFFPWKDVELHGKAPYSIQAGDCFASDTALRGSVAISEEEAREHPEWMCDAGSMSWDLKVDKKIAYNVGYGASAPLRAIKAFEMYWHAEGMKTHYTGTVTYCGQRYRVKPETCFGYADKNWGKSFTSPWVWLSSCCLTDKATGKLLSNSVFDIGGGRPKIFFLALNRKLLGGFWYEGKEFEYNFSKFWTGSKTRFSSEETDTEILWHVRQETFRSVMETEVRCKKEDMLLVNYEAPDGSKRHNRLWNGGTGFGTIRLSRKTSKGLELICELEATHIGCEYGEYCD